jgi:hypothetical protein
MHFPFFDCMCSPLIPYVLVIVGCSYFCNQVVCETLLKEIGVVNRSWCHQRNGHEHEGETTWGSKQDIMSHNRPLEWLFIWCLFWNILGMFWTKLKKNYWKILKIFIILLCYGLHKKIAENMSFSKRFKFIYKSFLLFKNIGYNVFKLILSIIHSLDWF